MSVPSSVLTLALPKFDRFSHITIIVLIVKEDSFYGYHTRSAVVLSSALYLHCTLPDKRDSGTIIRVGVQ